MIDLNKMDYIEKGASITDREILIIIGLVILLIIGLFIVIK
jgi:hypothetical protein